MSRRRSSVAGVMVTVAALVPLLIGWAPAAATTAVTYRLTGVFRLAPVSCTGGVPRGSWLQELAMDDYALRNTASTCARGAYTLLPPGPVGLSTEAFSPAPAQDFDGEGDSRDGAIISPVAFGSRRLGLATAGADVQDDPSAPGLYRPPLATESASALVVDLRSLYITWGGPSDSTCASAQGLGCWQEGTRVASGVLNASTGAFSLDWTSGQGFTPDAAGTRFHLEGVFSGRLMPSRGGKVFTLGNSGTEAGTASGGGANRGGGLRRHDRAGSGRVGTGSGSHVPGATRADPYLAPAGRLGGTRGGGSRVHLLGPGLAAGALLLLVGASIVGRLGRVAGRVPRPPAPRRRGGRLIGGMALGLLAGAISACGGGGPASPVQHLSGRLLLTAGTCAGPGLTPAGSWFEVVDEADGKIVDNPAGGCANQRFTVLAQGTDGGIELGHFQPGPTPTFDGAGNSLAARIVAPVTFGSARVGVATSAQDEQDAPTGVAAFGPPAATVVGTRLTVDLRSLDFTYEGPAGQTCSGAAGVGCYQLGSRSATGTYDAATRHFSLQWFVGEAFTPEGDSMIVHLAGTVSTTGSLTAQDQALMVREVPAAASLNSALSEVPMAMADVAAPDGTVPALTSARRSVVLGLLTSRPDLDPLSRAVRDPGRLSGPLQAALESVVSGRRGSGRVASPSASSVGTALDLLQTVYEDVLPALELSAVRAGRAQADPLAIVGQDPRLADLYRFMTGLDSLYGAGILAEHALG